MQREIEDQDKALQPWLHWIMALHGGAASVASTLGEQTVFSLSFPKQAPANRATGSASVTLADGRDQRQAP